MAWIVTLGSFSLWLVAALANVGGDFVDLLLIVPAALLVFQLWPRPRNESDSPLFAMARVDPDERPAKTTSHRRA